ncbi:MAG: SGNH/GDSL hydrolase family protein [Deltaproteobacteria bacterium]|nr:SGNH/GDSL hydrolase family protein [Deltaproteobacteria bacterium]
MRRWGGRLGLLLLSLAAGLALVEGGVRLVVGDRLPILLAPQDHLCDPELPGVPYLPCPGRRGATNNLGLRMAYDVTPEKPPGVRRIAIVGDSVTAMPGSGSGPLELFSVHLEALLRRSAGGPVQVLNLSLPGLSLEQELRAARARVVPLDPDLVVFAYCYNDPRPSHVEANPNLPFSRVFHSWNLLLLLLYERDEGGSEWYTPGSDAFRDLEGTFADLGRLARERPVAVAGLPLLEAPGHPQPHLRVVETLCRRNGIPYLDLMPLLPADLTRLRDRGTDSLHLSALGHQAVAEALHRLLARDPAAGRGAARVP